MSNKQLQPLRAGARARPIMPETFEDVQRIATMAVKSGLFKKASRDEGDDVTTARCSLAIMTGLDVGLSPAQSIQSIAVINGRCLIYGDAVPGILWAHGFDIEQIQPDESNNWTATCTITRPNGKKITRTFSKAQAIQARLWDERETVKKKWNDKWEEKPNDSPWFRFRERMLGWRALGFAKSDGASDVLRGLDIRENADETQMIDVTPTKPSALAVPDDIPDESDPPPSEAESNQDEPIADIEGYLTRLEEQLEGAETEADFDAIWEGNEELVEAGRLTPDAIQRASEFYEKHSKRFA